MSDRADTGAPSTVVQLDGVISVINGFPALSGIDLEIEEGEIVLVRGPNGAGKSTLLRLCAGLASIDGGSGEVLGFDLGDRRQRRSLRREAGLLAHQTFLYDDLTVDENVAFWAAANRVEPDTVDPVLDRLGLAGRLRSVRASSLSAGQRRRASLAVLVCRRPRLWLLDEPHAGLDADGQRVVDQLVRHAVGFGATVLISSHDVDRVAEVADRSVTLVGGRLDSQASASNRVRRAS